MSKRKKAVVKFSEIKETFVVRLALNQQHVDYLKSLVEAGIDFPPLLLSEDDREMIDGRHRAAALRALGFDEVLCEFERFATQSDKIIAALKCNVGGSLPPTEGDVSHVMQLLLTNGESRRSIIEKISGQVGFPARLIKHHLDYVQSNMAKSRLKKAVSAVVNHGKTVPEAAAEFGVKLETLQANLKKKGHNDDKEINVNQLKSHLSQQFSKLNLVFGHNLSRMARDLSDGVTKPEEAKDVISHVGKLIGRLNQRHGEWLKRFEIHVGTTTAAAETSRKKAKEPQEKVGKRALSRMGLD